MLKSNSEEKQGFFHTAVTSRQDDTAKTTTRVYAPAIATLRERCSDYISAFIANHYGDWAWTESWRCLYSEAEKFESLCKDHPLVLFYRNYFCYRWNPTLSEFAKIKDATKLNAITQPALAMQEMYQFPRDIVNYIKLCLEYPWCFYKIVEPKSLRLENMITGVNFTLGDDPHVAQLDPGTIIYAHIIPFHGKYFIVETPPITFSTERIERLRDMLKLNRDLELKLIQREKTRQTLLNIEYIFQILFWQEWHNRKGSFSNSTFIAPIPPMVSSYRLFDSIWETAKVIKRKFIGGDSLIHLYENNSSSDQEITLPISLLDRETGDPIVSLAPEFNPELHLCAITKTLTATSYCEEHHLFLKKLLPKVLGDLAKPKPCLSYLFHEMDSLSIDALKVDLNEQERESWVSRCSNHLYSVKQYWLLWEHSPMIALGNKSPIKAAKTDQGREDVAKLLDHIESYMGASLSCYIDDDDDEHFITRIRGSLKLREHQTISHFIPPNVFSPAAQYYRTTLSEHD